MRGSFSQRYRYEPLPEPMRLEELSSDLRRETWNALREVLVKKREGVSGYYYFKDALLHNSGRVTDRSQSCLNAIEFALTQACPDLAYDSAPHI